MGEMALEEGTGAAGAAEGAVPSRRGESTHQSTLLPAALLLY